MGRIITLDSTFVMAEPAAGAYAAGDEISNDTTAGDVVRPTFNLAGFTRGRVLQASMDITPASGNLVITALNLDLLIFKTVDVPAAVGDQVTFPITGAQRRKCVARFLFDDGGWQNPLGAYTAGTSGYQVVSVGNPVPLGTPTLYDTYSHAGHFDFTGDLESARTLTAALQVLAAWTPGAVVNTFGIRLVVEAE